MRRVAALLLLLLLPACAGASGGRPHGRRAFAECEVWILGDGLHRADGSVVDEDQLARLLALRYAPSAGRPAGEYQPPELPGRIGIADDASMRSVLTCFLLGVPRGFWGDYVAVCEDGTELPMVRRFEDYPVVLVDFHVESEVGPERGGGAAVFLADSVTAASYRAVLLRPDAGALLAEMPEFLRREAPESQEQMLVRVRAESRWGAHRADLTALHQALPRRAIGLLSRQPLYPPPAPPVFRPRGALSPQGR